MNEERMQGRTVSLEHNLYRIIASVASGAGVWSAGTIPGTGCLACLAFIPLILAIRGAPNYRLVLSCGAAFSLCWSLLKLECIAGMGFRNGRFDSHAIGWLSLIVLFLVAHTAAVASLYYLWIVRGWPCCLAHSTTWIASELIADGSMQRGFGLSLDSLRLATSQLDGGVFTQCADLGGSLLVSWLVTITNGLVLDLRCREPLPTNAFALCIRGMCFVIAFSLTYNVVRPVFLKTLKGPTVVLVPSKWGVLLSELTTRELRADLFIWPEGAHAETLNTDMRIETSLAECATVLDASIIVGCKRLGDGQRGLLNTACHYSPDTMKFDLSDKQFLAPISEFVPPLGQWFKIPDPATPYVPGKSRCWAIQGGWRVGVGICNDATFAAWGMSIMEKQPELLIVISNESFSPSNQMRKQLLATYQLRAIGTRRSILRCAMEGTTCLIDGRGCIVKQNRDWRPPTTLLICEMPLTQSWSLYQSCGDSLSLVITCGGVILGEYVRLTSRRNR